MAEISKVRFGGVDYDIKSITDTSLMEIGTPADAKAAGDKIDSLKSAINSIANNDLLNVFNQTISGTLLVDLPVDIPAGEYLFHIGSITSSDTDTTKSSVIFYHGSIRLHSLSFDREVEVSSEIVFEQSVTKITCYAATSWNTSTGDTFTYNNLSLYSHTELNDILNTIIDNEIKYDSAIYDDKELLRGKFENGSLQNGDFYSSNKYRIATPSPMVYEKDLKLLVDGGFRFGVNFYSGGVYISDSGWKTDSYFIPAHTEFAVVIAKVTEDFESIADIEEFMSAVQVLSLSAENKSINSRLSIVENIFRHKKYFSHLGITQNPSSVIIPSQSIFDVQRSKRLGFDVLEINVHKLADNNYICLHGSGGNFDNYFVDLSGNVPTGSIASKTLDWIKTNVRYVSKYEKYRTAPYTLQEILTECVKFNIIPLVTYVDSDEVKILNQYMGKNNYILNVYGGIRGTKSDAVLASWITNVNAESVVAHANESGNTFMCGINASDVMYDSFTFDDWKNYVHTIHSAGHLVSFVSAYVDNQKAQTLWLAGFDASGAGIEINDFNNGNLLNIDAGNTFADFVTNGTVTNGNLILSSGQTITIDNSSIDTVMLGGISLHIRFDGLLTINCGKSSGLYTSDGIYDTWVSSFIEDAKPNLSITASENTTVYEITYNASRM